MSSVETKLGFEQLDRSEQIAHRNALDFRTDVNSDILLVRWNDNSVVTDPTTFDSIEALSSANMNNSYATKAL